MLFNSIDFAVFLPIVFFIYWALNGNLKTQNLWLVFVSYVFYAWWDAKLSLIIAFSTIIDFIVSIILSQTLITYKRKILLFISLFANIGLLFFFKYFNFFIENFVEAFTFLGYQMSPISLDLILPVGISFYTFQTLSYTIDIYYKKIQPTNNFIAFAGFVSFFPQLVAGPIERASHLLPQFLKSRNFVYSFAILGLKQILWGIFKKMVIADNCAVFANIIFNDYPNFGGSTLLLGALFFSFQIYGDFSGYSDIAIGTAKLFGFNLSKNFNFPYFSRDIAEFWRRWHISLSSWFRDYIYIPLGGSKGTKWQHIKNILILFLISGFWHGANWTFIMWGALHALFYITLFLTNRNRTNLQIVAYGKYFPSLAELLAMLSTFLLVLISWIFFRSSNIEDAILYISGIFTPSLLSIPNIGIGMGGIVSTLVLIMFFIFIEWIGREGDFALERIGLKWKRYFRWLFYAFILQLIIFFMESSESPFIYFQF